MYIKLQFSIICIMIFAILWRYHAAISICDIILPIALYHSLLFFLSHSGFGGRSLIFTIIISSPICCMHAQGILMFCARENIPSHSPGTSIATTLASHISTSTSQTKPSRFPSYTLMTSLFFISLIQQDKLSAPIQGGLNSIDGSGESDASDAPNISGISDGLCGSDRSGQINRPIDR